MASKHRSIILIILISIKLISSDDTKEVKLKQGVLSGNIDKTFWQQKEYLTFKGVPYAEKPIGSLRFQPPKPHEKWDGVYEAYENKPTCLQFSARARIGEPSGISGSEDCLYLSVFTPDLQGNYPVVVFDYNDNFRTGFNGTDTYSPDFFIEEDVIVVIISHRLGLFGYLTTEDDVIPANNGLRDFILGLTWVKDNIANFGGDPTKVTLMGNKGGAAIVDILLYSEKAQGLFSGAILQSGTALEAIYFPENVRAKTFQLAERLEINAEDSKTLLEELQKTEAETLLMHEYTTFDTDGLREKQRNVFPYTPVVEGDDEYAVVKSLPEEGKIVNDVPVMIGLTSREGLDLASHFIFQPRIFEEILKGAYSFHFPIRPGFRFDGSSTIYNYNAATEINQVYYRDGYLHPKNILEYADYIGDTFHSYAVDYAAKKLVKDLESPVYYFQFDFRGSLNENSEYMTRQARFSFKNVGATVTDELCYLHLCARIKKNYKQLQQLVSEQPETKVLKKMVRMWTNFAKTRNPTPDPKDKTLKGIIWEPMNKDIKDAHYLHITKTLKMKKNPLGKRAEFWDAFLEKYSKFAVDGVVKDEDNGDNLMKTIEEEIELQENLNEADAPADVFGEINTDDVIQVPNRHDEF